MKINKKSQIAIFVILAILIGGLILTAIIFRQKETINPQPEKIDPIHSFVVSCLKQTGEDSISYVGYKGGYFYSPNLSTDNNIAYYFYEDKNTMPSKEKIESELSEYMNNMLFFCTKNFIDFPDFNIKQGEIKTNTTIEDNRVIFNVNYPLSIEKENNTYELEKFENIEVPVRLGVVYSTSKEIIEEQMVNGDICVNCILKIVLLKDLKININNINNSKENKSFIFTIIDPNSNIRGKEFKFNFASKYA